MKPWPKVRLGGVLAHYQEYIEVPEPRMYPKLSVKLYGKGVTLDAPADGMTLKMKRHQLAKAGQVILSEIWGKKGAIGFVPPEGEGALCTSHFFLFDVREDKLDRRWLRAILAKSPPTGWIVMDGVITSTGAGRGTLYTKNDYGHFRLMFQMRHVSRKPDHQACVLIFCTRPKDGEKPLDALGGIQFQVPNGGHWDYRPGHNNGGKGEFTDPTKARFDVHKWSQVEIVANAKTGTARMAVAQPPGSKAVEVLDFHVPDAGEAGPIALQMHNGGLFDKYRDITIEVDPKSDDLVITK